MSSSAPHPLRDTTVDRPLSDEEASALREVYQHPAQPQRVDSVMLETLAGAGLVTLECRSRFGLVFVRGRVTPAGRAAVEAACRVGRPSVLLGVDIYFHAADQLAGQPVAAFDLGVIGAIRLVSRASLLWVGYDRDGVALTDEMPHDEATLAVYDAARPALVTPLAPVDAQGDR